MSASLLDPIAPVLLIPLAAAGVLMLVPSYQLGARINIAASLLALLAAL